MLKSSAVAVAAKANDTHSQSQLFPNSKSHAPDTSADADGQSKSMAAAATSKMSDESSAVGKHVKAQSSTKGKFSGPVKSKTVAQQNSPTAPRAASDSELSDSSMYDSDLVQHQTWLSDTTTHLTTTQCSTYGGGGSGAGGGSPVSMSSGMGKTHYVADGGVTSTSALRVKPPTLAGTGASPPPALTGLGAALHQQNKQHHTGHGGTASAADHFSKSSRDDTSTPTSNQKLVHHRASKSFGYFSSSRDSTPNVGSPSSSTPHISELLASASGSFDYHRSKNFQKQIPVGSLGTAAPGSSLTPTSMDLAASSKLAGTSLSFLPHGMSQLHAAPNSSSQKPPPSTPPSLSKTVTLDRTPSMSSAGSLSSALPPMNPQLSAVHSTIAPHTSKLSLAQPSLHPSKTAPVFSPSSGHHHHHHATPSPFSNSKKYDIGPHLSSNFGQLQHSDSMHPHPHPHPHPAHSNPSSSTLSSSSLQHPSGSAQKTQPSHVTASANSASEKPRKPKRRGFSLRNIFSSGTSSSPGTSSSSSSQKKRTFRRRKKKKGGANSSASSSATSLQQDVAHWSKMAAAGKTVPSILPPGGANSAVDLDASFSSSIGSHPLGSNFSSSTASKKQQPPQKTYWAKGTGFGYYNNPQNTEWDNDRWVAQRAEVSSNQADLCRVLLHLIQKQNHELFSHSSSSSPPDSAQVRRRNYHGNGSDDLMRSLAKTIAESCLVPYLRQTLREASQLEIQRHEDLYRTLFALCRELSHQPLLHHLFHTSSLSPDSDQQPGGGGSGSGRRRRHSSSTRERRPSVVRGSLLECLIEQSTLAEKTLRLMGQPLVESDDILTRLRSKLYSPKSKFGLEMPKHLRSVSLQDFGAKSHQHHAMSSKSKQKPSTMKHKRRRDKRGGGSSAEQQQQQAAADLTSEDMNVFVMDCVRVVRRHVDPTFVESDVRGESQQKAVTTIDNVLDDLSKLTGVKPAGPSHFPSDFQLHVPPRASLPPVSWSMSAVSQPGAVAGSSHKASRSRPTLSKSSRPPHGGSPAMPSASPPLVDAEAESKQAKHPKPKPSSSLKRSSEDGKVSEKAKENTDTSSNSEPARKPRASSSSHSRADYADDVEVKQASDSSKIDAPSPTAAATSSGVVAEDEKLPPPPPPPPASSLELAPSKSSSASSASSASASSLEASSQSKPSSPQQGPNSSDVLTEKERVERIHTEYMTAMESLQFEEVEEFAVHHYAAKTASSAGFVNPGSTSSKPDTMSRNNGTRSVVHNSRRWIKRVAAECSDLSTSGGLPLSPDSSVYVRVCEEQMGLLKFLIIAPPGTPYSRGCFLFDAMFPSDYPDSPPKVNLMTTGRGSVRFNPNLYNCGKVCLSILNTWSGQKSEKWGPHATLLQVLISIQSLVFVADPYFNEPGYESSMGTPHGTQRARDYDKGIRRGTMRWAILDMLKNPPREFRDVIRTHFALHRDAVLAECERWTEDAVAEAAAAHAKSAAPRSPPSASSATSVSASSSGGVLSAFAKQNTPTTSSLMQKAASSFLSSSLTSFSKASSASASAANGAASSTTSATSGDAKGGVAVKEQELMAEIRAAFAKLGSGDETAAETSSPSFGSSPLSTINDQASASP